MLPRISVLNEIILAEVSSHTEMDVTYIQRDMVSTLQALLIWDTNPSC